MDFPGNQRCRVVVMAGLTSLVSRWLLFLVLPTDVGWTLQLWGGLGMWDGQGCALLPLLVAAPWLHLEGPGSISSPEGAWHHPALPAVLALISPNSWQPGIFPS